MSKVLYKDAKFELSYDDEGMYLLISGDTYELSCHPYEPCTYIKTSDGAVNIVMRNAFDLTYVVSDFEKGQNTRAWRFGDLTPLQFCELMEEEILRDKSKKKQKTVMETGYKTASKE